MRLQQYITESEKFKKPITKKFGFRSDNPMGDWLEHERNRAKKHGYGGSITAVFRDFIQLPTIFVYKTPGRNKENRKLTDDDVQTLMQSIKEQGLHHPPFIGVEYDGRAYIYEGNRRALVAKELKWKYIPVEIRYYAGGELIDGPWHTDKIAKIGKTWTKPKTELKREVIKKEKPTKEVSLKKWVEDEKKIKAKKEKLSKQFKEIDPDILDLLFKK